MPTADLLARRLFHCLPRTDQRRWAGAYLSGLLGTPGKKSVRNMARSTAALGAASQSLHQVVNASTWDWNPVRRELAAWCGEQAGVRALRMVPVVIPKRGQCSAGVHRRFDPAGGRTLSCQLALGLFLVTDHGSVPVDWRLFLPGRWSEDDELCERARIPAAARTAPGARTAPATHPGLGLDQAAEAAAAHAAAAGVPVVAEADTEAPADAVRLIAGLAGRSLGFAVSVPPGTPVLCGPPGDRAPHTTTVARLAARLGPAASPLAGGRLRRAPALIRVPGVARPLALLTEWDPAAPDRPVRHWVADPDGRTLAAVRFSLSATASMSLATSMEVLEGCGLLDFEGRSFPGWHRHMTLVSAAAAHRLLGGPQRAAARPDRARAHAHAHAHAHAFSG
ncbi:transposase [Streptomyces sp. NBC_00536]|uniref:IS701 family transposase n=1 Tax=Streptomyces sp. NBC_00536 TaxID=2975769 RepID=UPI002E804DCE|nr:transposase [Streptomyces sp. NBC_00536]WUC80859.1 transposase [Streptomyces sp. NBC_00536]